MTIETTEKKMTKADYIDALVRRGKLKNKTQGKAMKIDDLRYEFQRLGALHEDGRTERRKTWDAANGIDIDAQEDRREQYKEALRRDEPEEEEVSSNPITQTMVERAAEAAEAETRRFSSQAFDRRELRRVQARRLRNNRIKNRRRLARLRAGGKVRG